MGRALPPGPHSAGLWGLIAAHRSAIEHDWRSRYGLPLAALFRREVTWGEAWDLTSELLRDPDSHVTASLAGWAYVPGPVERVNTALFEAWVNSQRKKNSTPWRAPRPWEKAAPSLPGRAATVDAEARARLDAILYGTPAGEVAADL